MAAGLAGEAREVGQTLAQDPRFSAGGGVVLRAAAMGLQAAKRYADLFTAEDMVRKYVELYREFMAS